MMKIRIKILMLSLTILILLSLAGCGDDDPASPPRDTIPPNAVTDLRVESVTGSAVTLAWTAPGDDGDVGTASEYDIRYSGSSITDGNWGTCTQTTTEPEPAASGTGQNATINTGGSSDFYFALKTADEASNWSSLSNVVMASVGGDFDVRQLTNEGNNIYPCLSDGFVVWVRFNSVEGDEIYIANVESAMPTPTRLTDNGGEKVYPKNHGAERIVWQGRHGSSVGDWEIWLYNYSSIPRYAQFTDNDVPDCYPDLAGAGSFAWLQGYTMYEEVHYWSESVHSESVISDGCCSTSKWSNDIPSADDGAVVWRSYDRVGSEGHRIHLWDRGALTDLTDTFDAGGGSDFSLYAGTIAYVYGASPGWIKYWDGSTVQEVGTGYDPSLYNGTIAYEVWDGHDWEIRYWDGTTLHEITDNDYDDTDASLSGSTIAWIGHPPGSGNQIFYVSVSK